ncbi:MAG: hypothetical protein GY863_06995 [bacterium]|nr:hypothetical protein [bacterium]
MKRLLFCFTLVVLVLFLLGQCTTQNDFGNSENAYLGLDTPGTTPEKFAPGIVSSGDNMEYGITFSPDVKEIYFTRSDVGVMSSSWNGTEWSDPEKAAFSYKYKGGEVHITYDGQKMLMNRYAGLKDGEKGGNWALERTETGWDNPVFLIEYGMRATSTLDGKIYTTDISQSSDEKNIGVIAKYIPEGAAYSRAADPDGGVNAGISDAHPFIAPDESYIIIDSSRPEGKGKGDLYICYRLDNGSWSKAVNMEVLNTEGSDWCPTVSPDGRFLFFTRNGTGSGDIYWVDAKIIEELKPFAIK